jgi:DNA-binding transcriptional LysR family regulator
MNLKQAHYVKTIAECGSLTAAAKKLYVSQPSLSQMLRHVEEELGVEIFDRSMTPFRLTYAGERYLKAAKVILAANDQLESEIREIRDEQSGRLRLGISFSRGIQVLPLVIREFHERYPNVKIELTENGSDNLDEYIQQGKIDLALAAVEPGSANMVYELIEKETVGILAGKDSNVAKRLPTGTHVTLEDIKDDPMVNLRRGHSARVIQDKLFRKANYVPRVLIETDSLEVGKRITLRSGACMVLPSIYIDGYVAHMQGEFFPLADYENIRHFYACYRKDSFVPRYIHDFIHIVIDTLQKRPHVVLTDARTE